MSGSDLFTGTLEVLVLKSLVNGPRHGYAVGQWLRDQSDDVFAVKEGVLYPALHRLERHKWVKAKWGKTDTGRRARFYELTPSGRLHLHERETALTLHSKTVLAMLRPTA